MLKKLFSSSIFPILILLGTILSIYYKLFALGKIPFPGDLLVVSYSPWFDYHKFPVQNPIISDVFSQFFLWKYLIIDSFKNLQWPLWNPYSFMGTPLLATYHSAALYPLNILLLLPKHMGWGVYIFSQSLVASISMYFFLSLHLNSKVARIVGAIIFTFGGLMTTWLELGTAGHAIAWLPLCLYLVTAYHQNHRLRYAILLVFPATALILAGNAQITTYSFVIISLYTITTSLTKNLKLFFIHLLPIFMALFFSILLSSPQLLTSLDIFNKSIRLSENYTKEFNFGLLPAKDMLKLFIADFFGNPVTRNYWGFLNYPETSGFIGSLTLPLLLYSFVYLKKSKVTIFFLSLLFISLILAFDNIFSHSIYLMKIPLLTSSYASRMLFITGLSAAILSAFAVDQIIKSRDEEKNIFRLAIWSWATFVGILLGALLTRQFVINIIESVSDKAHLRPLLEFYLKDQDYALSNFIISVRNSLLPILLISGFIVFSLILKKMQSKFIRYHHTTVICIALFVLITFDLGRYFLKFNPFVSEKFIFPIAPAIEYLQEQPGIFRIGRDHAEILPPNTWMAYNLSSFEGYDPIYLNNYAKFMHYLNGGDLRTSSTGRYAELASNYSSPYLDAANVKYFIAILRDKNGYIPGDLVDYKFNKTNYKRVFQDRSAVILENPDALKRVYFASSFKVVDKSSLENIIMTDKKFDPRTTALLEKDLNIATVSGIGKASILSYSPNTVKIETKTENPEILILADQYDEGWRAEVDGQEVTISPANYIFRAIKVPAGEHKIIFNYYPKSFDYGLKIALTSLVFLSLISLFALKKGKF